MNGSATDSPKLCFETDTLEGINAGSVSRWHSLGEPVAVQFTAKKNIPLKTEANFYCRLYTVITPLLSLGAPDLAGTVIIQLTSQVDFACFIKIVLLVLKYLTVLLPTGGEERKIKFSRLPARCKLLMDSRHWKDAIFVLRRWNQ